MLRKWTISVGFVVLAAIITSFSVSTDDKVSEDKINWITIQELDRMAKSNDWKKNKRKVMIDIYTDWCGWCKRMDKGTFSDPAIVKYVNENFYAVKLNAEMTEEVLFGEKTYVYRPGGRRGTNEIAIVLASQNGRIGYPTITFLDENLNKVETSPGYKDANTLMDKLKYYSEGFFGKMTYENYLKKKNDPLENGSFSD